MWWVMVCCMSSRVEFLEEELEFARRIQEDAPSSGWFVPRPVQVKCVEATGVTLPALAVLVKGEAHLGHIHHAGGFMDGVVATTSDGELLLIPLGWWLIQEPDGQFMMMTPESFEATYQKAEG